MHLNVEQRVLQDSTYLVICSKPMVPFWNLVYFSGDWDVHWGVRGFDPRQNGSLFNRDSHGALARGFFLLFQTDFSKVPVREDVGECWACFLWLIHCLSMVCGTKTSICTFCPGIWNAQEFSM